MSVLRNLENKIAGLVEGSFSRVFRSEVRPVEIARKLAREMEEHQAYSLSRTYVPNEYRVYLSTRDRERFGDYEEALGDELAGYLLEHARRERFALLSRPVIEFETDPRLGLGQFGIETRVVNLEEAAQEYAPEREDAGHTMVHSTAARVVAPLQDAPPARTRRAILLVSGRRMLVGPDGALIGRSRDCDIVLDDPNVSRHHVEVRPRGGAWIVTDLGSTNGSRLNGQRLERPQVIKPGDEIEAGTSVIVFELD